MTVIDHPGASLLYRSATGLERAMADTDALRLIDIYAEAVIDVWDPYAISLTNLPYLAWAMGVNLWEDGWREHTQREWTARQWEFQSLRGTPAGIAMALDFIGRDFTPGRPGYRLVEYVAPPQGFYASPKITTEEWNAWIRQMPELRVTLAEGTGIASLDEWIVDDGFAGVMVVARDDGPALYGRRAFLRQHGVDTPLQLSRFVVTTAAREAIDIERICIPGLAGVAFVAGEDMLGEDRFVDADEVAPQLITYRVDSHYDRTDAALELNVVTPGLEPINVNYERISDIGNGGPFIFVNDFANDYFVGDGREAANMLADRIYLNDPNVAAPMLRGISFVGVDRVNMPKFNAELLIDLRASDPLPTIICEESFVADSFVGHDTFEDMDRAMRAVVASKAFRDRVLASFETVKPIAFRDNVTEQSHFGDEVRCAALMRGRAWNAKSTFRTGKRSPKAILTTSASFRAS